MKGVAEDAIAERAAGERPGRLRSVIAALVIGFAAGAMAYHLLRDEDEGGRGASRVELVGARRTNSTSVAHDRGQTPSVRSGQADRDAARGGDAAPRARAGGDAHDRAAVAPPDLSERDPHGPAANRHARRLAVDGGADARERAGARRRGGARLKAPRRRQATGRGIR